MLKSTGLGITKFSGDLLEKTVYEISNSKRNSGVQWQRFTELNEILGGFRKGELTVFSGRTGAGKTTFLCEYSLDLCIQKVPTLWGSFEIPVPRLCRTLLHQFSGKPLSTYSPPQIQKYAITFGHLPMFFMDAYGSQKDDELFHTMHRSVELYGIQHIILDNLQFLLGTRGNTFVDQFVAQDRFVQKLRTFTSECNCHVTAVVHVRKEDMEKPLTMNSIYGGAKISQEADTVMLLQNETNTDYPKKFIQVVKNRYDGKLGKMMLKFHRECISYRPVVDSKVGMASATPIMPMAAME